MSTCSIAGCSGEHVARGYCGIHYRRFMRHGQPTTLKRVAKWHVGCIIQGCGRKIKGHGYCTLHYQRYAKFGDPTVNLGNERVGERRSYVEGVRGYIELSKGKWAIVDAKHFERLNAVKWQYGIRGYAYRVEEKNNKRRGILMHHEIIGKPPKGMHTDHANGNRVDNRESNLRHASPRQNLQNRRLQTNNTSGYKGVTKRGRLWGAFICVEGRQVRLGTFESKADAARAYDSAAAKYFGSYARFNFPLTAAKIKTRSNLLTLQ